MSTLYAWVKPAFLDGSPLDHTWVTNYDNRVEKYQDIGQVILAGRCNWYCWGDYYSQGQTPKYHDGFIGSAPGSTSYAQCLCKDNASSRTDPNARGTIFRYAFHGVCHQLANQVLWATGTPHSSPLTVHLAEGYGISSAFYGDYGTKHAEWQKRRSQCRIPTPPKTLGLSGRMRGSEMRNPADSFERTVFAVLEGTTRTGKAEKLLKLRRQHQERLLQIEEDVDAGRRPMPTAADFNAMNNAFLRQAEDLLGPVDFQKIFGIPAGREVNIVDQAILDTEHH